MVLGFGFEKVLIEPMLNRTFHEMLIASTLVTFGLAIAIEDVVAFIWAGAEAGISYELPSIQIGDIRISSLRLVGLLIIVLITILLVEQNIYQSLELTNFGYVLENGRIMLQDTGQELLNNNYVKEAYLGM